MQHTKVFSKAPHSYLLSGELTYEEMGVLSQIQYWIGRCGRQIAGDSGLWIYNTLDKWKEQFHCFSLYKIKKILRSLEEKGFILSKKVNAKKWNHTKWYTVNTNKTGIFFYPKEAAVKSTCKKATNRLVENKPINSNNRNNYTKESSYGKKVDNVYRRQEEDLKEVGMEVDGIRSMGIDNTEQGFSVREQKCRELVSVWNEEFEYALRPIKGYVSKGVMKELDYIWVSIFLEDMEKWRRYARLVNSSKFLMGEKQTRNGFKAVFSWLVKKEVVLEILGGGYGVGDRELDRENIKKNIELKKGELCVHVSKKMMCHVKGAIDEKREEQEFRTYIWNEKFLLDGDKYGVKGVLTGNAYINSKSLVLSSDNRGIYKDLYDSYITKKYVGVSRKEISNLIEKNLLGKAVDGIGILKELKMLEEAVILRDVEKRIEGLDGVEDHLDCDKIRSHGLSELVVLKEFMETRQESVVVSGVVSRKVMEKEVFYGEGGFDVDDRMVTCGFGMEPVHGNGENTKIKGKRPLVEGMKERGCKIKPGNYRSEPVKICSVLSNMLLEVQKACADNKKLVVTLEM